MYRYDMALPEGSFLGGPAQPVFPRITPDQAAALAGQDVKQALDYVLYDTKYFKSGAAVPTSDIIFFGVQKGQLDQLGNDTTVSFSKTSMDTNLVQPSQLERGQTMIVRSIEAVVSIPGNFDLTAQSSGNTTLPSTLPTSAVSTTATAGVIAANLESAVLKMGVINFKVGNNFFENGPLIQFPSSFGISGYSGAAFTGTAQANVVVPNDAIANNGFGNPRILRFPRTILAGQNFGVILNFPVAFTPSRNIAIQICLRGELFRDVS